MLKLNDYICVLFNLVGLLWLYSCIVVHVVN